MIKIELINRRTINFWFILVVAVIAFGWMIAELARVFLEVSHRSGPAKIPLDGVMQHKIGELMVAIPAVAVLALSNLWTREKTLSLVRQTRFVMIASGLLNALAWYSLRNQVGADSFLRIWCVIIFIFGMVGSWLLAWAVGRTKN